MHLPPREPQADDFYIQMAPAHAHAHAHEPAPNYEDPFDDVFGSDSEAPAFGSPEQQHLDSNALPPDIRRLQVTHSTEGYREGITVGKAQSIQTGFDEGYSLGANVGLKAGQLLGLLEGIVGALAQRADDVSAQAATTTLLVDARRELRTERIFDEAYWAPDGSWKYDVKASGGDDAEVVFEDVASQHPVILKWTRIVEDQVQRWQLDLDLPALKSRGSPQEEAEEKPAKVEKQSRQAIDW